MSTRYRARLVMGPIERELRCAGPSTRECVQNWLLLSNNARDQVAAGLANIVRTRPGIAIWPEPSLLELFPDIWSEAIEAAEELGL